MSKIAIGIANYGNIRTEVFNSLSHAFKNDVLDKNILHGIIQTQSPYIDDNRNSIINFFLDTNLEWLLFVDTDVEVTINDIYNLYDIATKYNLYVLGGIYFWGKEHYSTEIQPMIKIEVSDRQEVLLDIPYEKDYFNVSSIGTGSLLIHRSVFEKINNYGPDGNNYWFKTYHDDIGFIGEDIYFCKLAKDHGFNIYATSKVMPNHYKTVIFNNHLYKKQNNII